MSEDILNSPIKRAAPKVQAKPELLVGEARWLLEAKVAVLQAQVEQLTMILTGYYGDQPRALRTFLEGIRNTKRF